MKETEVTERLLAFLKTFQGDPNNVADTPKFDVASKEMRSIVESIKMPADMEETHKRILRGSSAGSQNVRTFSWPPVRQGRPVIRVSTRPT